MKLINFIFCTLLLLLLEVGVFASGSGKSKTHSTHSTYYNLGVHSTATSKSYSSYGHTTNSGSHLAGSSTHSYSNPKSAYHSSLIGNSTYFRANKYPPKHSEQRDKDAANKKAKAAKDAKALEPAPKVQHAIDPFKPKPKPKPGTFTPAAPIFLPH